MAERRGLQRGSESLVAILFAAFAAAAVIAFLRYRDSDIGRLPQLFENLTGGPLFGLGGVAHSAAGMLTAGLIAISWFGLGSLVGSAPRLSQQEDTSPALNITLRIAIGAAIWSPVWFFLGLAGAYSPIVAGISVTLGLALAALHFRQVPTSTSESKSSGAGSIYSYVLTAAIALVVLVALISALAPPIAKDTLLYHFALPKAFIAQRSNAFIDGNIASYLALGTEMHVVWAMLLGGFLSQRAAEAAAGASMFLFFPLVLAAVYGWLCEMNVPRTWALISAAAVATVPTAFQVASSGYGDLALTLFVTLAVYALTRWWKEQTTSSLVLMAIFLGAALSIKLTAIFVIAAFALILLLKARGAVNTGKVVATGFSTLLLAGLIASPWYIRTWSATGSPIFPFYMSILEGKAAGWDVERSNLFQAMNSQYGGDAKSVVDYLTAPVHLAITAQPEMPRNFDGVMGVAFLIALPILIWGLWNFELPVEAKICTGVAAIVFLFWLFSSQQLRYLLPILPMLSVAIFLSTASIAQKRPSLRIVWQVSFSAAALVGLSTSAAWFMQKAPLRVVLGGETREEYLTRNLDYYPFYELLNGESNPDAKVWLINMRRDTYHLDRPVFSDYLFEDWTLRKMLWESGSAEELRRKAATLGVQYALVRHDFLFDYDRSTLVDDKRSSAENSTKLQIAKSFVLDPIRTVRSDDKFSLIKVF
ncbi:MAG: ArnT family glycosyltransferase [Pyrinomonadaceae bacterium]